MVVFSRKPKPHIPQRPQELTAEYLTEALASQSDGSVVTSVEHTEIGVGIGFVGEIFRLSLTWDTDDPSLPRSIVAKVPATVASNRAIGEALLCYEREIIAYNQLHETLGLPMPKFVHSAMDPNPAPWLPKALAFLFDHLPIGAINWLIPRLLKVPNKVQRRYLLLMEDIDDARPATQFDGGDLHDAHEALKVLAEFHAKHWMDQELLDEQPLIWSLDRTPKVAQASYLRNRDAFVERFGKVIDRPAVEQVESIQDHIPELMARLGHSPWTVLHGDYRLDNILFRDNGDIVVLDYQLLLWGRAGWDVAYFITTGLDHSHKSEEQDLLRTYHEALIAAGVTDYGFDELVADANMTKDVLAHRMVGASDVLNTDIEGREQSLLDMMVTRVVGWVAP